MSVRDLWSQRAVGTGLGQWAPVLPPHGAGLYQANPE